MRMNVNAALPFIFLQCIIEVAWQSSEPCTPFTPGPDACPEQFELVSKNSFPICLHTATLKADARDAQRYCVSTMKSYLVLNSTVHASDFPLSKIFNRYQNESFWILNDTVGWDYRFVNASKYCTIVTKEGGNVLLPCCAHMPVTCEALVKKGAPKPVATVTGPGQPKGKAKFQSLPLTVQCSVTRSSYRGIYMIKTHDFNGTKYVYWDFDLTFHTVKTNCGVRTVHRTSRYVGYLVKEVFCMIEQYKPYAAQSPAEPDCGGESRDCAESGGFSYSTPPKKPQISVKFDENPNIVREPNLIRATCSYGSIVPTAIRWSLAVRMKNFFLNPSDQGVEITDRSNGKVRVSTLTLATKDKNWSPGDLLLGCYFDDFIESPTKCTENDFWCSTIVVNVLVSWKPSDDTILALELLLFLLFLLFAFAFLCKKKVRKDSQAPWGEESAKEKKVPSADGKAKKVLSADATAEKVPPQSLP